ncbi:hypothetical protein LSM04_008203 [Trypanosoma melophagium]|uniref:uncharacterized protein n=1 Tax=Trypanosoma melophagium TaxID=715481 RepID=UPI00351A7C6A|nr:hypothetical protein LSM04_008203 [Trypanosoma melophagium]
MLACGPFLRSTAPDFPTGQKESFAYSILFWLWALPCPFPKPSAAGCGLAGVNFLTPSSKWGSCPQQQQQPKTFKITFRKIIVYQIGGVTAAGLLFLEVSVILQGNLGRLWS